MCRFSRRELEILKLQKDSVKSDKVIADQLGIHNPEQVAVHRSNARRKIVRAKHFYQTAMKEYGSFLFPGTAKKYKT